MNDYRNFQRKSGQRRLGKGKHGQNFYGTGKGKQLIKQKNKYSNIFSSKYIKKLHQQRINVNKKWINGIENSISIFITKFMINLNILQYLFAHDNDSKEKILNALNQNGLKPSIHKMQKYLV